MDLYDYGQLCAKRNQGKERAQWQVDFEMCEAIDTCYFCGEHIEKYTAKSGYEYRANRDRSPHRVGYECVRSWTEFQRTRTEYEQSSKSGSKNTRSTNGST